MKIPIPSFVSFVSLVVKSFLTTKCTKSIKATISVLAHGQPVETIRLDRLYTVHAPDCCAFQVHTLYYIHPRTSLLMIRHARMNTPPL
jgi:hypothetical protein